MKHSFKDSEFYCIDRIIIGPQCTIRKIFTLKQNPCIHLEIPKKFCFTHTTNHILQLIDAESLSLIKEEENENKLDEVITSFAKFIFSFINGESFEKVVNTKGNSLYDK
jgi:hypothetical protein